MKIFLCSLYGRSGMIHYASQLANALAKKHEVYILISYILYHFNNINIITDENARLPVKEATPKELKRMLIPKKENTAGDDISHLDG